MRPHRLLLVLCTAALSGPVVSCADGDAPDVALGGDDELAPGDEGGALIAPPEDTRRRRRCADEGDCRRGQTCDKKTCDAEIGICVDIPSACPDVWAPQCGCDGRTYGNACERRAAGVDLRHDGPCKQACDGIAGLPCPDGMVCIHEPGTCDVADDLGVCVDKPTACPDVWWPVCGCDGKTYGNRCEATAAGVSVSYKGECVESCAWNGDCADADYCAFEGGACGGKGTCEPRPQACPLYYRPVCGCDGKTYGNQCEAAAAGVSVSHAGACVEVCDGIAGIPCAKGQFCDHRPGQCDVADAQGVCVEQMDGCPRVWQPVCGCDGATYANDCERIRAGVQKEHEGACEVSCKETADCPDPSSQLCKQEGCGLDGVCVARPSACTKELVPVCGCDGQTYDNACLAALHGVTVRHEGACYCGARLYTCDEGEFCDWAPGQCDIADNVGTCVPVGDACPAVWLPVCGCDGQTYGNDCERIRAGVQKLHDGPCELVGCKDNAECKDDEWCARADCDVEGTCQPRPLGCPDVWEPVCGCDGETYSNKCDAAAAGVPVAHEGECLQVCGGIAGVPCDEGEFCDPFPGECDVADGQGHCVPQSDICPAIYDPVCGCDGVTYSSDCVRVGHGVGKDHDGKCECAPVLCDLYCEHGFARDDNGCEICQCNPPPACCDPDLAPDCWGSTCCGDGKWYCGGATPGTSDASEDPSLIPPPPDVCGDLGEGKVCDACPGVMCDLWCPWGFQVGQDGCEICACNPPPCGGVVCTLACEHGFVKDDNGCEICECAPGPECPPLCDMYCRYGNVIDANGCELCQCNPAPACCEAEDEPACDDAVCCDNGRWWCPEMMGPMACAGEGEICKDECPGVMCTLYCEYGFEIGADGCEICDCKEPPASACCRASAEPGCQHGATCCDDGTWSCNRLDGTSACKEKGEVCAISIDDASTP